MFQDLMSQLEKAISEVMFYQQYRAMVLSIWLRKVTG
jgi:hypothetical protein